MDKLTTNPIARALGLTDADIEGLDDKCFDPHLPDDPSITARLFMHDKLKGTYYCSRTECIKAMYRLRAKKMYARVRREWIKVSLYEYEKENIRQLMMIDMQKRRYGNYYQ